QRAADEQQRAEGEQIAVGHPLLAGQPTAQIVANVGQRDVDDGPVDEGDDRAQDRGREGQPLLGGAHVTEATHGQISVEETEISGYTFPQQHLRTSRNSVTKLLLIPLEDTVVFPTMDVTLPVDTGDE